MLSKAKSRFFSEKRIYVLLFFQSLIFNVTFSFGQGGTWTWISGSDTASVSGVYGTQGVPSVNNHPPGEYEPCEWKDKQGNFWIYGGTYPSYNDLWQYNCANNEWTWVKGNGLPGQSPVYGIQGVANPSNTPGDRTFCAATWVDTAGDFWLFGGIGTSTDLWKYDISSNQWIWMKGDSTGSGIGVHGIQGVSSLLNTPGARSETCSAWTDSLNNLWLFGGAGIDDNSNFGSLNDLCKYDISTNEWTWMKGADYSDAPANYGIIGVADSANDPGARSSYTKWKDVQGDFWLMGGLDANLNCLNDVWKYNLSANEWTWMSGPNIASDTGRYQTNCVFDTISLPYSRYEQRSSVADNCGRFWLFGGAYFDANLFVAYRLNDLWVFDPEQLTWNRINGTNALNQTGDYGSLGMASPANSPPSRFGAAAWWGNDNKFYLFGGLTATLRTFSDVWVFNPDTSCLPVCGAVAVAAPIADFQVSQASICANACISFTDLSTNATSWQWHFAGALDSISTDQNPQNICYSTAGIYNVTLIASNAGGSNSVTFSNYIAVNAAPPNPTITQSNDTLFCSTNASYASYQWYLDSNLISGATDTSIVITSGGDYNVKVSNASGCSIAVGINIVLGIQNYSNDNIISIYPNPATDELLIDGSWKMEDGSLKLTIISVLGEIIYTGTVNRSAISGIRPLTDKQETVNCNPFPSGIYFVQVANDSGRWVGKFVKE